MAYILSNINEIIPTNALQHTAIRLDKNTWYIKSYTQKHKLIWLYKAMLITRTNRVQDFTCYALQNIIVNHDLLLFVMEASNISLQ